MKNLVCLLSISSIALAGACSSSSTSTKPTDDQYDDTAQQIGAEAAPSSASTARHAAGNPAVGVSGGGEIGAMDDVVSLSSGATLTGFTLSGSGQFAGTHLGLSYDYTLTCKDAGGNTLTGCTALTSSAAATADWSGTLTLPNISAMVNRTGDWQVTSLLASPAVVNGSGSLTFDATVMSIFRPVTTKYTLSADADYNAVAIDTTTLLPVGGNITYAITATDTSTVTGSSGSASANTTFDINGVLTFAADGTATLVLDGTHTYSVNTTTGVVVKVS